MCKSQGIRTRKLYRRFAPYLMDPTKNDLQDLSVLKPKEACDETAEVSNSYRKEAAKITDSKQPSEMADIKHELKNVIFNRRLAKGLDHLEIPTTPANKPTVEKLTKEEEEKRQQRRERNKVAAQKCREKKRIKMEHLSQEADNMIEENEELAKDIRSLQLEKETLISRLRCHRCVMSASDSLTATRKGQ